MHMRSRLDEPSRLDPVEHLGRRLLELTRTLRLLKHRHVAGAADVPTGLVGTLIAIDQLGPGCQARVLAARTGLDPSTISRAVSALVGHGLVERHVDPLDRRAALLTITATGRTALADVTRRVGATFDRALTGWTEDEVADLSRALARLTTDLERALELPISTMEAAR